MDAPHALTAERLEAHALWIGRLARSLVRDPSAADDLVQETWLAALRHRPSTDRPLRPWLRTVLVHFARRRARRPEAGPPADGAPEGGAPVPGSEELAEKLEGERVLVGELAALEEPYRSTLLLRYYEGLEPSEIARRLGLPAGTVRWRVKRALELLRERLDARHGGDRRAWMLLVVPLGRTRVEVAPALTVPALSGALLMSTLAKLSLAAVGVTVAVALALDATGNLPASLSILHSAEPPMEVRFRPIAPPEAEPEVAALPVSEPAAARRSVPASAPLAKSRAEPPAAPTAVEAVVTDEAGRPLAGAVLELRGEPDRTVRCDAAGAGRLELQLDGGSRRATVVASHEGYASRAEDLVAVAGGTVELGRLVLGPGGALSGRVLDEVGRGLAGVRVTWADTDTHHRDLERSRFDDALPSAAEATTVADGSFRLTGLPVGFVRLWAHTPGREPTYTAPVEVRAWEETFGIEVVMRELPPENSIRLLVVDPDGAPVARAVLDFEHRSDSAGVTMRGDRVTDADGRFEFVLPADAVLSVVASDPGGSFASASAQGLRTGPREVVLQLQPTRHGLVRVVDERGDPVARYGLEVLGADGETVHQAVARAEHADGVARFVLPSQAFRLRVVAPLHAVATTGPIESGPPLPSAAEPEPVTVRVESLPGLAGVVLATDGEPIDGARVSLVEAVPDDVVYEHNGFRCRSEHAPVDHGESDAEGRFRLTPRSPGSYYVRGDAPGRAPADAGPIAVGADLRGPRVELRLGDGGTIAGRVVPADRADPTGTIVGASRGDGHPRTQRVGADGAYAFEGLTPGPWRIALHDQELVEGYGSTRTSSGSNLPRFEDDVPPNCEVVEGRTTWFELNLDPERSWRVHGRLLVDGEPRPWALRLLPEGAFFLEDRGPTGTFGPDGSFEVSAESTGRFDLAFRAAWEGVSEQFLVVPVEVADGMAPIEIDLATGTLVVAGLAGWDPQGMPSLVHLWDGPDGTWVLTAPVPDEQGVARAERVPAGEGRLVRPSAASFDPAAWEVVATVDVPVGRELQLTAP